MHQPVSEEEAAALMAGYDRIAEAVLDDHENTRMHAGVPLTNKELCNLICVGMGWEDFDILDSFPFEDAYASGDLSVSRSHMFLAFLKHAVVRQALIEEHGNRDTNTILATYCELWYKKLSDKVVAMSEGKKLKHMWIH